MLPIQVRPRIVLSVRQLQIIRAHADSHIDDGVEVIDVEPVDHAIDHHRIAVLLDPLRAPLLQLERSGVRQKVIHLPVES